MRLQQLVAHKACQVWWHGDSFPGQFNGWLKQFGPGQLPVLSVEGVVAQQLPGNANPLTTCNIEVENENNILEAKNVKTAYLKKTKQ